ncbi:MAG: pilin [Patescibacteria group bacterium]
MKKISQFAAILVLAASFGMPLLAAAATNCPPGYISIDCPGTSVTSSSGAGSVNQQWAIYYKDTIVWAVNWVLVPVLMAIAFIVFLWGIFKYFIWGAENESEKAEGRKFAMWGIIGFVIIMSVWGIVNIVKDTLVPTTAGSTRPNYPTL